MKGYIVTKEEINAYAGVDKTHFLNPDAQRTNKSLGDLTGLTGFGFHIISVPVGCVSTEFHRHHHEDECVYVLQGEGEAVIGETVTAVKPGDFIGYRAGGEAHQLRNTGATELRCIVVGERRDHDVGDYPLKGKRIFRNKGLPWNLVSLDTITEPDAGRKR